MKRKLKLIPNFLSEEEEREFWDNHNSMDYIDWNQAKLVAFSNLKSLKSSAKTISLRLLTALLAKIKVAAHKND